MHRKLSRGWNSWVAVAAARREAINTRRALRHLKHRKLSRGWNSLAAMAAEQRAAQEVRAIARSCVLHLANRKLSMGWNSWAAMAAERLEVLELLQRSMSFLPGPRLFYANLHWNAIKLYGVSASQDWSPR